MNPDYDPDAASLRARQCGREHWPAALGGVDWMTPKEMTECVPPAYTEHLGRQIIAALEAMEAVA